MSKTNSLNKQAEY